jgi:hypothetical protein
VLSQDKNDLSDKDMRTKTIILGGALLALVAGIAGADPVPGTQIRGQAPRTWTQVPGGGSTPAQVAQGGQATPWRVYALQTPGEPALTAESAGDNSVTVHWPASATNYSLVVATNRARMVWQAPAETIQEDGTNKFIRLIPQAGVYYYQLERNK